jgi:hypothetical protein
VAVILERASEFRHVVASVEKALISSQEMHREKQALQRGKSKMKKETDYSIRNQRNVLGGIQEWRYMSDSFFQLHLCCRAAGTAPSTLPSHITQPEMRTVSLSFKDSLESRN